MRRIITVSVGLLLLVGCGTKHSGGVLMGTVTYKGQPVNGAVLALIPASGEGNGVNIPVTQEGTFRTSDVPPGEYKIVVQGSGGSPTLSLKGMSPAKQAEAKEKLAKLGETKPTIPFPAKYKSHLTTDLKCTVAQGEQTLPLELKD